jgi:Fur family ferric uptake transcriptional regulator
VKRETRQKRAVREILSQIRDFRSAQHIHRALVEAGDKVGLTTVYRALTDLVSSGQADQLLGQDGETLYRGCSPAHHHHLICVDCGETAEIDLPGLEQATRVAAERFGYLELSHNLEIFGRCRGCQAKLGLAQHPAADLNLRG